MRLHLPPNPGDAARPVAPRHLVPYAPRRSSWDGWFAIAVFPREAPVRWMKAHFYHCTCRPGRTPFAAVEGFRDRGEIMLAWAGGGRVEVRRRDLDPGVPEAETAPLRVERAGRFRLAGEAPRYAMDFSIPEEKARVRFDFEAGWPIWWSRWGGLLQYAGQHAAVRVEGTGAPPGPAPGGLGVMEHVCGASLPFDFTRALPFHYHWDVLAFHTPGSPTDSAAGLSIGRGGETLLELRAAARLPGRQAEAVRGLRVRYLETEVRQDRRGADFLVPVRWQGELRWPDGRFRYEARAATPLAGVIPAGGMLGFDFSGAWSAPGGGRREWEGTGFCEYGDFSGTLAG